MSSAVRDLQQAIVRGQQSLTQLLRQTKLIAAKLKLDDIGRWVDLELNGYPDNVEPPDYRKYSTSHVEIRNPMRGWLFGGPLAVDTKAHEPISEIENFSKEKGVSNDLFKPLPVSNSFSASWPQRIVTPGSEFKRIVEGVTNELLNWTIQLEDRGIKGESMNFNDEEKKTAGNMVFNIGTVNGAVGNVNHSPITFYDNKTINQLLFESNIPKKDKRELEDVLDELKTAPADKKPSLIQRGEQLIVKHKDGLGVSAEILGKFLHGLKGSE